MIFYRLAVDAIHPSECVQIPGNLDEISEYEFTVHRTRGHVVHKCGDGLPLGFSRIDGCGQQSDEHVFKGVVIQTVSPGLELRQLQVVFQEGSGFRT